MADSLNWQTEAQVLRLCGELDRETLTGLWQQRQAFMQQVTVVDVTHLQRVDSAGLALLVHLTLMAQQQGKTLSFQGITGKMHSLITLYNLQPLFLAA